MGEWLFQLQLQISIAVVAILLLRQTMKKMPKVYSYLLWLLVFARLLVPVSIETRFSFMPSEQEKEAFVAEVLENFGEDFVAAEKPENPGEDSGVAEGTGSAAEGSTDVEVSGNLGDVFTDKQIGNSEPDVDLAVGDIADNVVSGEGVPGTEGITAEAVKPDAGGLLSEGLAQGNGNVAGNTVAGEGTHTELLQGVVGPSGVMWILFAVWAVGTIVVLGYNGLALHKVRRSLQSARYLVDSIQIGKGNAPVYVCDRINTPFSLGFLKPVIYLPGELTAEEQEYILCHERVHISRKDNLVKHVAFLLTAIYWFNPFVWVAFFLMERDMEMSCDEKVLKIMGRDIKKNYSQSLLNFAEGRGKMPATHLTFGENSVKQRVKNVLSYKNAKKWSIVIGAVVLVVVVVALFTTGREDAEGPDSQGELGQELVDGPGSLAQSGETHSGSQGGSQGDGLSKTPQLALDGWKNRFTQHDGKIVFSEYDYNEDKQKAAIRYVVEDGWERYMLEEIVEILTNGDTYYVERESLTEYRTFYNNAEFEIFYGTPGLRDLNLLKYDASYYRRILQQFHEGGADVAYCARFTDPVTAAVEMLNLGEGSGVARLKDGTIVSGGGQGSIMLDVYFTEGTYAYVTYTFAKDGSQLEVPMRLIEGSYGLWSVDPDAVREITREPEDWKRWDMEQRLGFAPEFTQYGIYRNVDGKLTNMYPYYMPADMPWMEKDGILYFATDATYQEGAQGYQEDVVGMLDLATGEMDLETLSLENMPMKSAGYLQSISIYNGTLVVCRGNTAMDSIQYCMPLINTGNTALATGYTYNGKAVKDLTEPEQDAYGVALREEILKSGEVMNLSNRTMTETYAYVDLDGDGKTEKIVLSADTASEEYQYVSFPYDCFRLQVDDSVLTGMKEHLENELRFFSPDGKNIVIALFGDGPSDDYTTMLYLYKNGELRKIGEVQSEWTNIVVNQVEDIFYVQDAHHDFIQPAWLWKAWRINESGQVEEVPQETYDMTYGKFELPDLLVPLPVYESPGSGEVTYIQPQKVDFIKMDNTFRWVYIEAVDGTSGWFGLEVEHPETGGVDVRIKGLEMNHWEVFTTYYAG